MLTSIALATESLRFFPGAHVSFICCTFGAYLVHLVHPVVLFWFKLPHSSKLRRLCTFGRTPSYTGGIITFQLSDSPKLVTMSLCRQIPRFYVTKSISTQLGDTALLIILFWAEHFLSKVLKQGALDYTIPERIRVTQTAAPFFPSAALC